MLQGQAQAKRLKKHQIEYLARDIQALTDDEKKVKRQSVRRSERNSSDEKQPSIKTIKAFQKLAIKAFDESYHQVNVDDLVVFLMSITTKNAAEREPFAKALPEVLTRQQINLLVEKLIDIEAKKAQESKSVEIFMRTDSMLSALMVQERRSTMYSEKNIFKLGKREKTFFEQFVKTFVKKLKKLVEENFDEIQNKDWSKELCEKFSKLVLAYYETIFSEECCSSLPDFVLKNAYQIFHVLERVPTEKDLLMEESGDITDPREHEREILIKVNGYVILRFLHGLIIDYCGALEFSKPEIKGACFKTITEVLTGPLQNISNSLTKEKKDDQEDDADLARKNAEVIIKGRSGKKNIDDPKYAEWYQCLLNLVKEIPKDKALLSFKTEHLLSRSNWCSRVLMLKTSPKENEIAPNTLVMRRRKGQLTAYWLEEGKIISKTFEETEVRHIIRILPPIGQESNDTALINAITLKYGCTPSKESSRPVAIESVENSTEITWADIIRSFLMRASSKPNITLPNSPFPFVDRKKILKSLSAYDLSLEQMIEVVAQSRNTEESNLTQENYDEEEDQDVNFSQNKLVKAIMASSLELVMELLTDPASIDWLITNREGETLLSLASKMLFDAKKTSRDISLELEKREALYAIISSSKKIFDIVLYYFIVQKLEMTSLKESLFEKDDLYECNVKPIHNTLQCAAELLKAIVLKQFHIEQKKVINIDVSCACKMDSRFVLFFLEKLVEFHGKDFSGVKEEIIELLDSTDKKLAKEEGISSLLLIYKDEALPDQCIPKLNELFQRFLPSTPIHERKEDKGKEKELTQRDGQEVDEKKEKEKEKEKEAESNKEPLAASGTPSSVSRPKPPPRPHLPSNRSMTLRSFNKTPTAPRPNNEPPSIPGSEIFSFREGFPATQRRGSFSLKSSKSPLPQHFPVIPRAESPSSTTVPLVRGRANTQFSQTMRPQGPPPAVPPFQMPSSSKSVTFFKPDPVPTNLPGGNALSGEEQGQNPASNNVARLKSQFENN
jgi:hypothetical protein